MPVHVEFPVAAAHPGGLSRSELANMTLAFRSRRPACTVGSVRGPFAGRLTELFVRGDRLIGRFSEMPAEYRRRFLPGKFHMELRLDGPAITNIIFAPSDVPRACTGSGCIGAADSVRRFSDRSGNSLRRVSFSTRRPVRRFGEDGKNGADEIVEGHYAAHKEAYQRMGVDFKSFMAGWKIARDKGMKPSEFLGQPDDEKFADLPQRTFAERQVRGGTEASQVHDHFTRFSDDYKRLGCHLSPAQAVSQFLRLKALDPMFSAREFLAGKMPRMERTR